MPGSRRTLNRISLVPMECARVKELAAEVARLRVENEFLVQLGSSSATVSQRSSTEAFSAWTSPSFAPAR